MIGGGGGSGGGGSRRQSNVPRYNDNESVSSLQGSLKRVEYSPKSSQRKQLCRTPLYLSENSRTNLEQDAAAAESLSTTPSFNKTFGPLPLPPPSSSSLLPDDELPLTMHQYQLQSCDAVQKRPFSMFRPHRIFFGRGDGRGGNGGAGGGGSCSNDEYRAFLSTFDLNCNVANRLRECKSLDLIPINQHTNINNNNNKKNNNSNQGSNSQLRHRNSEAKRLREIAKCASEHSACSLDAGVSMISRDPMPAPLPLPPPPSSTPTPSPLSLDRVHANFELGSRLLCTTDSNSGGNTDRPAKRVQHQDCAQTGTTPNNCNGPLMEDAQCPLLFRQNSLNNPQDDCMQQQKRWRSLETMIGSSGNSVGIDGGGCGTDSEISAPKKSVNRGTIRSWLVNLFVGHQGNGFSDASLRKAGVVQNRSFKGFSGVSELPAPEHESIV